jgi:hypothetical protein
VFDLAFGVVYTFSRTGLARHEWFGLAFGHGSSSRPEAATHRSARTWTLVAKNPGVVAVIALGVVFSIGCGE